MEVDLRYPIGTLPAATPATPESRRAAIDDIAALPRHLRKAVDGLNDAQLETPYRPGGWTVRQVVHHVADSHMNGYIRLKLALTEDSPTIKPYDEKIWADLPDSRLPVEISLNLLDVLHTRWTSVCLSLRDPHFSRGYFHPELGEQVTIDRFLQSYSWHARHHVAHITALRQRERW
jgi:hypothetical protein